jgi:hypothetical protein
MTLPVPPMTPLSVSAVAAGARMRSWELSVTAPLKMAAAELVRVALPELPEATEIALVCVPAKPPLSVVLAEPEESPRVIVPVPKAAAVVPRSVPALTVTPPEKVFAPESVSVPVPSFVMAPVVVPMIPVIEVLPDPVTMKLWVAPLTAPRVRSVPGWW